MQDQDKPFGHPSQRRYPPELRERARSSATGSRRPLAGARRYHFAGRRRDAPAQAAALHQRAGALAGGVDRAIPRWATCLSLCRAVLDSSSTARTDLPSPPWRNDSWPRCGVARMARTPESLTTGLCRHSFEQQCDTTVCSYLTGCFEGPAHRVAHLPPG
jgi:hypothetical protein